MTSQEVKVWNWLREELGPLGFHFRRQVAIDNFIIDFACLRHALLIEIDGDQHGRDPAIQTADQRRDDVLRELGYRVLRFTNRDVDRRKREVMDTVFAALDARPHPVPSGPPSPAGEGSRAPKEGHR